MSEDWLDNLINKADGRLGYSAERLAPVLHVESVESDASRSKDSDPKSIAHTTSRRCDVLEDIYVSLRDVIKHLEI